MVVFNKVYRAFLYAFIASTVMLNTGFGPLNYERLTSLPPNSDWQVYEAPFLLNGAQTRKVLCSSDGYGTLLCLQYHWQEYRYMALWVYMLPIPMTRRKMSDKWVADFQLGNDFHDIGNRLVDVTTFTGVDDHLHYVGDDYMYWRVQVSEPEVALGPLSTGFLNLATRAYTFELILRLKNGKTQRSWLDKEGFNAGMMELVDEMLAMRPGLKERLINRGYDLTRAGR